METIESLQRRIASVGDLLSVVRTMKALAAVSIRQYEKAVEALLDYSRTVELGAQVLVRERRDELSLNAPRGESKLGAIIFGSDQGMCGQFNEEIATYALTMMDELDARRAGRRVLAIGGRVSGHLLAAKQPLEELFSTPASTGGITPLVQDILLQIDQWGAQDGVQQVYLFFNTLDRGASYSPHNLHLLPMDVERLQRLAKRPWPSPVLPTFHMDWNRLFSALVRQYLFISIYQAAATSLASENAARLAAMQAAEKNIQEHIAELTIRYHQQRQTAITEELLDIVSGFEVLAGR
jgi:F-type H+-transporting ATPase subunit gamma